MMLYGIRGCTDPPTAFISSVTYWVFSCRDNSITPAKGLDKWNYLGSAIEQSGMRAESIEDYIANLASRLKARSPVLSRYAKMLAHEENQRIVLFGTKTESGGLDIREFTSPKSMPVYASPADALQGLLAEGVRESDLLALAKPTRLGGKPFVIQMFCQVADQIFGYQPPTADEESAIDIDVEVA
jgi:hypothetical protein